VPNYTAVILQLIQQRLLSITTLAHWKILRDMKECGKMCSALKHYTFVSLMHSQWLLISNIIGHHVKLVYLWDDKCLLQINVTHKPLNKAQVTNHGTYFVQYLSPMLTAHQLSTEVISF
jgi:hypothetical protein